MTYSAHQSTDAQPLLEEGLALQHAAQAAHPRGTGQAEAAPPAPTQAELPKHSTVVVIGAGQTGLSTGYHLARLGVACVILDANDRIGDTWRRRWDSLKLFTPARYNGLDGWRFPAPVRAFPGKDAMADYLEAYAARFRLDVRTGVRVDSLSRRGPRYVVRAGTREITADHVVVAMGTFQKPRLPDFARSIDPAIVQLHSTEYRNPSQLRPGRVLVVGAGNSGSEVARELAANGREVVMSGRDTGHIPFRIEGFLGRHLLVRLVVGFAFYSVLTTKTPIGRKLRPGVLARGGPLIRVKPKDLKALGVQRVGRTVAAEAGQPVLEDGRRLAVDNIVWCTGFRPDFSWIDLPIRRDEHEPEHDRGVVPGEPGLYFIGLEFLYAMASAMVQGAGRDARHIAGIIAQRTGAAEAAAHAGAVAASR